LERVEESLDPTVVAVGYAYQSTTAKRQYDAFQNANTASMQIA